jgi:phage terminase large subunit-like protein
LWSTACPDWEDRLLSGRSLVPDLPLFPDERDRALRIFNRLRVPDVVGRPAMADAGAEWFRELVAVVFGSFDVETERRMIQEVFLLVPKKNGKTSYSAALMLTALIVNRRPEAEYLLIAPTMKIADTAFKQARGTIRADPELVKTFHIQEHARTITDRRNGALLKIIAADTDVITGQKATGILIDEIHVLAKKPKAAEVYVEIRGSLAARPDGFLIQITTQSKEPPVGVFKAELAIARDIRDGLIKLPRLPVLFELPQRLSEDDGWKDQETWPLVNPNLGRSVDGSFLSNALIAAEREGKEALALLASQHFNVEVGLALRNDHWPGARYWQAATDETLTLDELLARCEVIVAGVDGGGLDDLYGFTLMGRCRETKRWLSWSRAWVQPEVLDLRKDIASMLRDLEKADELKICEFTTQDIEEIVEIIGLVQAAGLLPEKGAIGLDAQGVSALVDGLLDLGLAPEQLAAVPQGYKLMAAIKGAERKLKDRTIVPSAQALMTWCVGNARVEPRGNAILITKQVAGLAKIDPLMAFFNAFELMSRHPEAAQMQLTAESILVV